MLNHVPLGISNISHPRSSLLYPTPRFYPGEICVDTRPISLCRRGRIQMQHAQSSGRTGASVSRRRVRKRPCVLPVPEGPCGHEKAAFPFLLWPISVFRMGQGQVELEDQGWCSDSEPRLPAFSVSAPIWRPGLHGGKEGGASPQDPDQRFFQQKGHRDQAC